MTYAVIDIPARAWTLLKKFLRTRRRRCRDCHFCGEQWLSSPQGQGLYKFWFCEKLIYDLKVVEPDIERRCENFERKRGSRGALNGEVATDSPAAL